MREILNIRMLSVRAAVTGVLATAVMLSGAQAESVKQSQKSDKQASSTSPTQPPKAVSNVAEDTAPADKEHSGVPHEGIKIHGHWVIDVRSTKGDLVEHREFQNSYVTGLPGILAGQVSIGGWQIGLTGAASSYVVPAPVTQAGNASPLTIGGTWTATSSDTVSAVKTSFNICDPSVSPAACATRAPVGNEEFSAATLPVPVPFVLGQIVQITVTFSFS